MDNVTKLVKLVQSLTENIESESKQKILGGYEQLNKRVETMEHEIV